MCGVFASVGCGDAREALTLLWLGVVDAVQLLERAKRLWKETSPSSQPLFNPALYWVWAVWLSVIPPPTSRPLTLLKILLIKRSNALGAHKFMSLLH